MPPCSCWITVLATFAGLLPTAETRKVSALTTCNPRRGPRVLPRERCPAPFLTPPRPHAHHSSIRRTRRRRRACRRACVRTVGRAPDRRAPRAGARAEVVCRIPGQSLEILDFVQASPAPRAREYARTLCVFVRVCARARLCACACVSCVRVRVRACMRVPLRGLCLCLSPLSPFRCPSQERQRQRQRQTESKKTPPHAIAPRALRGRATVPGKAD